MRIGSYDLPKAPKLTKKRKTQAQRDEEIVAKAGPWYADEAHVVTADRTKRPIEQWREINLAAARILNRIARASGGDRG